MRKLFLLGLIISLATLPEAASAQSFPADINADGTVDSIDWLALLSGWGPCAGECPADLNGDGTVDSIDWLALLSGWGPCPAVDCPFECMDAELFCTFSGGTSHGDLECTGAGVCCELPQLDPCPYDCSGDLFQCMVAGGTHHDELECANGNDCCLF